MWIVVPTKRAAKELERLPRRVGLIYAQLVADLQREGPRPFGWDVTALKGSNELRIRLNRQYRVRIVVIAPKIIVVRVAHRKEVYR
jgi:mRNA-degrading endonuclease RelE of RelBE toxin-antitoxin system